MQAFQTRQLEHVTDTQISSIATLIYASGKGLFDHMFENSDAALIFLNAACTSRFGQFGFGEQWLILENDQMAQSPVIGSFAAWDNQASTQFIAATQRALVHHLSHAQLSRLVQINTDLSDTFAAPKHDELCLGHISVAANFKQQGVASAMLASAIELGRQLGKRCLVLDVENTNEAAIACYQKSGFECQNQSVLKGTELQFIRMNRYL